MNYGILVAHIFTLQLFMSGLYADTLTFDESLIEKRLLEDDKQVTLEFTFLNKSKASVVISKIDTPCTHDS